MKMETRSVAETRKVGARFARESKEGAFYVLEGELGTGKTEFVRGFVHAISAAARVRSPSFSILNIYETDRFPVYHFDFYRLSDASELGEIGFEEYIGGEGVCLVEWGTLFPEALPSHALIITFADRGGEAREITWPDTLYQSL
jgi:tRNA threonylcarbamoyladenosine biosynthesis protein TsaE